MSGFFTEGVRGTLAAKKRELAELFDQCYETAPCRTDARMRREWNEEREELYFELVFGVRPNSAQLIFSSYCNEYLFNIMASANGTGKSFWCTGQEFHAHLTGFRPFICDLEEILQHIADTETECKFDIVRRKGRGRRGAPGEWMWTYRHKKNDEYRGEISMLVLANLWQTAIPQAKKARFILSDVSHVAGATAEEWIPKWCGPWISRMKKNQQGTTGIYEFEFGNHHCKLDLISANVPSMQMLEGWEGQLVMIDEPIPEEMWKATIRGLRSKEGQRVIGALTPIAEPWMFYKLERQSMQKDKRISWLQVDFTVNRHNLADDFYNTIRDMYGEAEADARFYGRYKELMGLVLSMFKRADHVLTQDSKDYYPPKEWIRYRAIDVHGPRKGHFVIYAALSPLRNLHVYHEIWIPGTVKDLAQALFDYEDEEKKKGCQPVPFGGTPKYDPLTVYRITLMDPRGWEEEPVLGTTMYDKLWEYGIRELEKGSKKLEQRVKMLQEWFGLDRVFVAEHCERTLFELETWKFKEEKPGAMKTTYNKPEDKNNDMLENLGRIVIMDPLWVPPEARTPYSDYFGRYDDPGEDVRKTG